MENEDEYEDEKCPECLKATDVWVVSGGERMCPNCCAFPCYIDADGVWHADY